MSSGQAKFVATLDVTGGEHEHEITNYRVSAIRKTAVIEEGGADPQAYREKGLLPVIVLARKLLLHFFPILWPQKLPRVDIPARTLEAQHSLRSIRALSKPVVEGWR